MDDVEKMRKALRPDRPRLCFDRAALLLVDMQIYQTRESSITRNYERISPSIPEYYLRQVSRIVEPNCERLLALFRWAQAPVIFTQYASVEADESDLPPFVRAYNELARKSFGAPIVPPLTDPTCEVIPGLEPRDSEWRVQKSSSGAFTRTDLDRRLRERGIEQLVVAGVLTHACVETTARTGSDLGYEVIVVGDACATLDPVLHESSLAAMELLSIKIATTDEMVSFGER